MVAWNKKVSGVDVMVWMCVSVRKNKQILAQHKQCEFFVQQLFEKRLNPFLKRPEVESTTHTRHVTSREASGSAARATGAPLLTLQRSVTVSEATSQQPETDTQTASLTSQRHTKFDRQQRGRTWIMAPKPVQEQYACAMTLNTQNRTAAYTLC